MLGLIPYVQCDRHWRRVAEHVHGTLGSPVSPQLQQGANVRVAATQVTPGDAAGFVSWIQPSHVGFHGIAHGDGSTLGKPLQ